MSARLPLDIERTLFEIVRGSTAYAGDPRVVLADAWHRPVALACYHWDELVVPLDLAGLAGERSLALARLLYNIYEQNGLYLPEGPLTDLQRSAFEAYYEPRSVAAGAALRPALEGACFAWIDEHIDVAGRWNYATFEAHVLGLLRDYEAQPSGVCEAIAGARSPRAALCAWLVQVAPDFISEASQMARALPGNYGPAQSELMKIFIDEFGYGVHRSKHSTLFERTLASVGLASIPHAYYGWYLPSSLHMANYFHWVTATKPRWLEYLGALYWIEAVVPHFNRQFSRLLGQYFGGAADTEYFDEHVGIDLHHRRQVLHKLIRPTVAQHGDAALSAILRGVEVARMLGEIADRDFLAQLAFCEALAERPRATWDASSTCVDPGGPRLYDRAMRLHVEAGAVAVEGGCFAPGQVEAGDTLEIPAGRIVALLPLGPARHRLEEAR